MDEEFGISSLVEEMKPSRPSYTSKDLRGLKVLHDQSKFSEGATTVLTLADRGLCIHVYVLCFIVNIFCTVWSQYL